MIIYILLALHWYISLFCQTFFLHRYGAHAMFIMKKGWERFFFILTWVSQGSSYLSPRAYAVLHRMHHAYSDTEKDPHSPHHTQNLFTMMWETKAIYNDYYEQRKQPESRFSEGVPDWSRLDKLADSYWARLSWAVLYICVYFLCITVYEMPGTHAWMYLFLPIHFLVGPIHGAIVNWSGHKYGYSNYDNNDKSKNSLALDFLMMGELFQNNHHKLPNNVNFASKWFEFDPSYPLIKLLEALRIIKLKKVS